MSVDPSVIAALEAAVAADPANPALRVHLAELLVEAGRADAALDHSRAVLAAEPTNTTALALAALAAELCGEDQAAADYGRLLAALGAAPGPRARAAPPPPSERVAVFADPAGPSELGDEWADVQRPVLRLADVAGMAEVKARLELAFLGPLRNPELAAAFRASLRGGMLLWGPPGCGKTFLARALAGELGAAFVSIGLADVLDQYLGQSERNLHDLFEAARRHRPCVLFLDELDAVGQKRGHLRHAGGLRNVVAQLLTELDGVDADNEGLFVLGATNHPWDVDVALRRPGRFDRTLLVLPPDEPARRALLESALRGRPVAADLDLGGLAARTDGFSGADLVHLCDTAVEHALAASLASGSLRPLGNHDLRRALGEVRPSIGTWFDTAENYAQFAGDGEEYRALLDYLRPRRRRR
ncbi:MAG: ATP-binding protein [Acidimicrobiales bacterium]